MKDADLIHLARCAANRKDTPMERDEAILMLEVCRRLEVLIAPKPEPMINVYPGGILGVAGRFVDPPMPDSAG